MEVLIFKAESGEGEEDPYVREIKKLNVQCDLIPVLSFEFENAEALRLKLSRPHDYSGLVLTSPRAVEAVARVGPLPAPWRDVKTYAVGETTRDLARKDLGLQAEGSHTSNAAALALYIVEKDLESLVGRGPLLMPCGERRREELGRALGAAGGRVEPLTAYRTVAHPALDERLARLAGQPARHTVVFFSPSGVDTTVSYLRKHDFDIDRFEWIAIGPTTEAHMKSMGIPVSTVCARPTPGDVREAVARLLARRGRGGAGGGAGAARFLHPPPPEPPSGRGAE